MGNLSSGNEGLEVLVGLGTIGGYESAEEDPEGGWLRRRGAPAGLILDFLMDEAQWWPPVKDPDWPAAKGGPGANPEWRAGKDGARSLPTCWGWHALFVDWRGGKLGDLRL